VPKDKTRKAEKRANFEEVAWVHMDAMFNLAMKMTRNRAEAEDLVQETYLRAYRFFDQYEAGTNCKAWLFRILRNNFINRYRQKKRKPETVDLSRVEYALDNSAEPGLPPGWGDPEKSLDNRIVREQIQKALDQLPPDYRMVVVLSAMEGLTYREVASVMDTPIGTVMSRLHRARKLLQTHLVEHLPGKAEKASETSLQAPAGNGNESRQMEDS
jgi:RNA polymerase sigma-70 factor (ECF subfamily)